MLEVHVPSRLLILDRTRRYYTPDGRFAEVKVAAVPVSIVP